MNEYQKLRAKFDKDVKELRDNCPHTELSEPGEVYWAIGHSAGYSSRVCLRCAKLMDPNPWKKKIKIEKRKK
jgi:hypothetical protein